MVNLIAYLSGQNTAGKLQLEAQAQKKKKTCKKSEGKGRLRLQSQKLPLTVKLGDSLCFSLVSKPKFREVKTHVKGHTANKCWLLDLNLDLAHPKASRLKILVWSF